MPKDVAELVSLLQLEEIEVGLHRADQPRTQRQRAFGGQVLGQAVTAVSQTVPPDRQLHSLHAYFLLPGRTDMPMIYETELVRDGGTYTNRQVHARQAGRTIFTLAASFHVCEDGLDHAERLTDELPDPQDCPLIGDMFGDRDAPKDNSWRDEWGALDIRFIMRKSLAQTHAPHPAAQRFWMKINGRLPDDPRIHEATLAYMSDLTLLSATTASHDDELRSIRISPASLDHSMWFHRPFHADEWLVYDQVSPSASRGNGLSLGLIYQDSKLVATVAQEGKIRVRPRD